jgi:hypothetical protein
MKKISLFFVSAVIILSSYSCRKVVGEGPSVTETRNTSNFDEIEFGVPGTLYYTPSSTFHIEIQAQKNILEVIETYVVSGELRIKVKDNTNIKPKENIIVNVSAPDVKSLTLSGSGSLKVLPAFKPYDLRLRVSGSGSLMINDLTTGNIDTQVSGSGDVQILSGTANNQEILVSGSGKVDYAGLSSKTVTTHTSGSGTIKIYATEKLDCHISGSGIVMYKGSPQIKSSISGSGKIIPL